MSKGDEGSSKTAAKTGPSGGLLRWVVLITPLAIALIAFAYQADTPNRLGHYQTQRAFDVTETRGTLTNTMTLTVVYPTTLLLEEGPDKGRPVQIWLSDPQSSYPPRTYTVILDALVDGAMFTDDSGTPLTPSIKLKATKHPLSSGSWFLHRTPAVDPQLVAVKLKPGVLNSEGNQLVVTTTAKDVSLGMTVPAIEIGLESPWQARLRTFLDRMLGPATPIVGIAVTFAIWLWNKNEGQREQESKYRKDRRDREITDLDTLWNTNQTNAVRHYFRLQQEANRDQDSGATARLDQLWEHEWQTRSEQVAIASLARGDYAFAHELRQQVCPDGTGAGDPSAAVASQSRQTEHQGALKEDTNAACTILTLLSTSTPTVDEKIQALMALAASRGSLLTESLVLPLVESFVRAISAEDALSQTVEIVKIRPSAQWLIATAQVQKYCQDRIALAAQDASAARSLRNLAFSRIEWPAPWPPASVVEPDEDIEAALERLRWKTNPFGVDQTENEPRALNELWVESPVWQELQLSGSVVLWGEAGLGQTFVLRYLLQTQQEQWRSLQDRPASRQPLLFPVWLNYQTLLTAHTRQDALSEIGFGVGQALLQFLAFNPYLFDRSAPSARMAIARLCVACQSRVGSMEEYLDRFLAEHDKAGGMVHLWLPELIRSAAAGAQPVILSEPGGVLYALQEARLAKSQGYLVVADFSARWRHRPDAMFLTQPERTLLETMPELGRCGVTLNVGLPTAALDTGVALESRQVYLKTWPKERLNDLLMKRLKRARAFQRLTNVVIIEDWMVQVASGSPQRLVRLGNHLLAHYGRKKPDEMLAPKDLDEVLRQLASEAASAT